VRDSPFLTPVIACLVAALCAASLPAAAGNQLEADIDFDASSAREILFQPETILGDPDGFWRSNPAYRLVAMWHKYSGEPIRRDRWLQSLGKLADVPAEVRPQQPANLLLTQLMEASDVFQRDAVPHICSFLPKESINLDSTIHLTAKTHPRAFQIHEHIVLDITNRYYRGNADAIMNCLVHETFHIGYGNHQRLRTELDLDNATINSMLNSLQNEGMATYVGYTAQHLFPAPDDRDYEMLERKRDVKIRRKKISALFDRAMSENPGDLGKASWRTGVKDRGYYVVGAYMAKMIDERLGRDALIATVEQGPRAFVRTYNEIADEKMRLVEFEEPVELSRQQQIRQAALDRDAVAMRGLLDGYADGHVEAESALEHTLVSAALLLQHDGEIEMAIEVLEADAAIHPQSSAAYQFLGDAYALGGLDEKAVECYRRCIELEPDGICAFNSEQALAEVAQGR
jgi:tetratricopeptide (TPR) repeat protein